jgi:hypothetical protein
MNFNFEQFLNNRTEEQQMKKLMVATAVLLTNVQKTMAETVAAVQRDHETLSRLTELHQRDVEQRASMTELLEKIVMLLSKKEPDNRKKEDPPEETPNVVNKKRHKYKHREGYIPKKRLSSAAEKHMAEAVEEFTLSKESYEELFS